MTNDCCSPGKGIPLKHIPLTPDCCGGVGQDTSRESAPCPLCRKKGRHVENTTVRHLLRKEMEEKAGQEDYYLCMDEKCDIAYYNDRTGTTFRKKDIIVPLWFKEDADPRYACYCSRITQEEVIRAVREQKITDMNAIRKYYDPEAASQCKIKNPAGRCCSPVFGETIKKAKGFKEH
ncbi:(2Fe-2S)-binding protein [Methanolobus chelungpuianus]|uniref:(2Fe-2S)-binding protein n=1 Tax=Methanolobus chelungpuianus TaxID=502115 RepID=UPI002114FB2F|nr:(2Fe-2S)-binding protein [Methanolobus chelungpuianus]